MHWGAHFERFRQIWLGDTYFIQFFMRIPKIILFKITHTYLMHGFCLACLFSFDEQAGSG